MNIRKKIEDKIKRKEQDIQGFEIRISEAKAYIQALQETIRLLPKSGEGVESKIRPGSAIAKTLAFLKKTGRPMHINEILEGIGKSTSKKDRAALSGSLGWYVRGHEIFTRTAPNTFALIGMELNSEEEPPDDFGVDKENGAEQESPEVYEK